MWSLNTCGEADEIELTAAHGLFGRTFSGLAGLLGRKKVPAVRELLSGEPVRQDVIYAICVGVHLF